MKCSMCAETMTGDVYAVCPECFHDKPRIIRDADLRDEVAMAVLPEMARQQNNWKSGVMLAFEWADAFMSERARRREGR